MNRYRNLVITGLRFEGAVLKHWHNVSANFGVVRCRVTVQAVLEDDPLASAHNTRVLLVQISELDAK